MITLGTEIDANGIYHIRQDWWQSSAAVGYNDLYDAVFGIVTDMDKTKFEFSYEGREFTFWAWKGDYINLGAGAELGIYRGGLPHKLTATEYAMPMTLRLESAGGEKYFDWAPSEPNWWITGFDPQRQTVQAKNLTATYTVDFTGQQGLYEAFHEKWKDLKKNNDGYYWTFNVAKPIATFNFK
jgi:hypothetical protein